MKKQLLSFFKVFLLIILSYLLISLILAGIMSFIQLSSFVYHLIINIFSYFVIVISSLYFYKVNDDNWMYLLLFVFIYDLMVCLINIGSINVINMIIKSVIFILINIILIWYKKKQP